MKWTIKTRFALMSTSQLAPHPDNAKFTRAHKVEEYENLRLSIEESGIQDPVKVCGPGCTSPEGTILDGHARVEIARALGFESVPVVTLVGLGRNDEHKELIAGNLAKHVGRRLSERELATLEKQYVDLHRVGRGARTDLKGGAESSSAIEKIAKIQGYPSSRVKDRLTVFFNEVSTEPLREAVDINALPRSIAAQAVRGASAKVKSGALTKAMAAKKLNALVESRTTAPVKRGRPAKKNKCAEKARGPMTNIHQDTLQKASITIHESLATVLDVALEVLGTSAKSPAVLVADPHRLRTVTEETMALAYRLSAGPLDLVAALHAILDEEAHP